MYKTYLEKLNEITSKAKGVELEETIKVELGLVQDIDKIHGKILKEVGRTDKLKNKAIESIREFKLDVVKIKQDSVQGLNKISKLEKEAKDLGMDIPDRVKGLKKDFSNFEKAMKEFQASSDKAMKLL